MLVLAELIVCSVRGFASILANERVLDSLYFSDDSFQNSYGRNNPIFEFWSYTLFVDL